MAKISQVTLVLNGDKITGFSKFKENDIEIAQTVELTDGEDVVEVPAKYGFSLTYLPNSGADIDWVSSSYKDDVTAVVQYTGGKKVVYTGCKLLKQTFGDIDGKTAKEYQLDFHAKYRKVS